MFTDTDYDKLRQLMAQNPGNRALIQKLLDSHEDTLRTVSHEIRNPLTLVYSTLQLIEAQHPEVTTFRHWDSLRDDIIYMKELLEELSSYNNGSALSVKSMNFRKFMEQIVLSFATSIADSPVEFSSCLDPAFPPFCGDPIKLREVFLNLLRNAAEATESTGDLNPENRKNNIQLHAFSKNGNIIVTITDSGCGIPEEFLSDIFQPFVTHKQGGTGLGLAISKRIVESHSGQISVQSTEGMGTTFTITLPIK